MLTSTKCTFVGHESTFRAPRVVLPCPTSPTSVILPFEINFVGTSKKVIPNITSQQANKYYLQMGGQN